MAKNDAELEKKVSQGSQAKKWLDDPFAKLVFSEAEADINKRLLELGEGDEARFTGLMLEKKAIDHVKKLAGAYVSRGKRAEEELSGTKKKNKL